MKNLRLLSIIILIQLLGVSAFAHEKDPVLGDNPTEEQMQLVRDGAKDLCENVDDDNEREMCVMDYYAQHNLEEEPSCD
jgi:chromosome condensin MukBEF MukE localization factor